MVAVTAILTAAVHLLLLHVLFVTSEWSLS
jgi:hypothetical protein